MTEDELIEQLVELEDTLPEPDTDLHRERRRQMWRRILDIREYFGGDGPEPRADWKLTVPDATEEEKEAMRARAAEWFRNELNAAVRDLDATEAEEAGGRE